MAVSEAQKRANQKWDKDNMMTLGCRLKKEDAEAFKEYCAAKGTTANTALRNYVLSCIGKADT